MFSLREADSTCKMLRNGSRNSPLLGDAEKFGALPSAVLFPYFAVTVR